MWITLETCTKEEDIKKTFFSFICTEFKFVLIIKIFNIKSYLVAEKFVICVKEKFDFELIKRYILQIELQ